MIFARNSSNGTGDDDDTNDEIVLTNSEIQCLQEYFENESISTTNLPPTTFDQKEIKKTNDKEKEKDLNAATGNNKRPLTAWHAFQRTEKDRVKQAGFHGRVAIVREIARRWKLFKQVGTSNAPLMLGHSSDEASSEAESVPDGLVTALADLSPEELSHALQAQGIEDTGDRDTNVAALARAMVA